MSKSQSAAAKKRQSLKNAQKERKFSSVGNEKVIHVSLLHTEVITSFINMVSASHRATANSKLVFK